MRATPWVAMCVCVGGGGGGGGGGEGVIGQQEKLIGEDFLPLHNSV